MFKKLLTGIIIALAIFGGIYGYFLYAGDPSTLRSRIATNRVYAAVFFISVVMIYMLQWTNKLFRFLMFIIILINAFILGDLFFRNNIGLDSRQFITLFGLILVALATTYITHRVRYIVMGIIGLGIVFVLLTGILPMYETIPNINDFISSQKVKIINQWAASEWILVIKDALGTRQIPVSELQENDIDLSQKTQISFISKTTSQLEKIFIDLGNGLFVNINPQSAITLEQSWDETIMQILQGNVQYYIPEEFSWAFELIGKYQWKSIQNIKDETRAGLVNQFEDKKQEFFINQIGWNIILNPAINKVIKFFINTLHTVSPKAYEKNLANYNNIQQYLWISTTGEITPTATGENLRSIIDDLMGQIKKWAEETSINSRLNR